MATYTIVSKDKQPLGPNEIHADDDIMVSNGDVFIIHPGANSNLTFKAIGGGNANFEIRINSTNNNGVDIKVEGGLTPNINVANGVNMSGTDLDLKASNAATLTAGNNVTLGRYEGSVTGPNTVTVGDNFTTNSDWKFGNAADRLTVGDDATFKNLDAGAGNDTITFGDDATIHDFDTKAGNDSVTFGEGLDANNLKTSDGNDTITIGDNAQVNVDGGSGTDTLYTDSPGANESNIEASQAYCYAPGTLIDTPDGPRPVESLQPGDLVRTLDHGPQAIHWTRSGDHPLDDAPDDARPVLIKAGALGPNVPDRDLIVSPQHRILVGGGGQLDDLFGVQAFAPAKSLIGLPGVRHMVGKARVTWVHFACHRHEVVRANGCLSESLLLGAMVLNGLSATERRALTALFGHTGTPDAALNGPPARNCLKVGAVRREIARHHGERPGPVVAETRKRDRDQVLQEIDAMPLRDASPLAHASKWIIDRERGHSNGCRESSPRSQGGPLCKPRRMPATPPSAHAAMQVTSRFTGYRRHT